MLVAFTSAEALSRYLRPLSTVGYQMDADVGPLLEPKQTSRWVNEDYDVVVRTNSAGFHDSEHPIEKPSNRYRILVLGDSYIEALQVPVEKGFTQQLERRLSEQVKAKEVEVINLGVSGSGPAQYYRILEMKGLLYEPDLVVMAIFPGNDFWDSDPALSGAVFKPYYVIRSDEVLEYRPPSTKGVGSALRPWLRRSALLHLVRQAIASLPIERWLASMGLLAPAGGIKGKHVSIPLGWSVYLREPPQDWLDTEKLTIRMIREASVLSKSRGAAFLAMVIGSVSAVENRWEEALAPYPTARSVAWDFSRPVSLIQELGWQAQFDVIDLTEPFRSDFLATGQSSSWPHDGHWNERGHRLGAEVVSSYLVEHGQKYRLQ